MCILTALDGLVPTTPDPVPREPHFFRTTTLPKYLWFFGKSGQLKRRCNLNSTFDWDAFEPIRKHSRPGASFLSFPIKMIDVIRIFERKSERYTSLAIEMSGPPMRIHAPTSMTMSLHILTTTNPNPFVPANHGCIQYWDLWSLF